MLQFLFSRRNVFLEYVRNVSINESFSVPDIVSMVKTGEWDNVSEPSDENRFESAEDSGNGDFGGKHLSITFCSYFF